MAKKIILASGSPRRKELMKMMGLSFRVDLKFDFEEMIPVTMPAEEVPEYLAVGKSMSFYRPPREDEILITADTVVICDGIILGKPHHRLTAKEMLMKLSGRTHQVVSAVCVRNSERKIVRSDIATVSFNPLTKGEIDYYVEKFRPVDKAGGYGIQEWIGLIGINRIEGSFYTIMGLPTHLLWKMLKEFSQ